MVVLNKCGQCGADLGSGLVGGLCPRCVVAVLRGPNPDAGSADNEASRALGRGAPMRFGEYELLEQIAHGGMGVVWRARQVGANRIVALKMILAGRFAQPGEIKRFRAEAEAAAQLDHPNIVPIYDVGEYEGQCYFTMKLVEGRSLAQAIHEGICFSVHCRAHRMPLLAPVVGRCCVTAARLLAKVARAVHYAHQRGVLHRDLTPGNILVDAAEEPHVTDFGLAKRLDTVAENGSLRPELTATGAVLGTPAYLAPEQASGGAKHLTTAADIYSLGAILYELLTGRPPFNGKTALATLQDVQTREPARPRTLNPHLDRDLETICLKCLEKDPAQRYNSAGSFADDLERFLRNEPIYARPSTTFERVSKWTRRNPVKTGFGAAFVAVVLLGAGGVVWEWREANSKARESEARLIRVLVANGTRRVQAGDPLQALPWFAEALRLEQSDSVPAARDRCCLANALRQCVRPVHAWFFGGRVVDASFSPDGRYIAAASEDGTARMWDSTSGKALTPVMLLPSKPRRLAFSPDGAKLAVGCEDGTVHLWNAHTGKPVTPPLQHRGSIGSLVFTPGGERLAISSDDGIARMWEASSGEPLTPKIAYSIVGVQSMLLSADGQRLFTFASDETLHVWRATTGEPLVQIPETNGLSWYAALSPDDKLLAIAARERVLLLDSSSGEKVAPPLNHTGWIRKVVFSLDGKRVATASEDGTARVWEAASGRPITGPLRHENGVVDVMFSPDSERLVTASRDRTARLWDANSGKPLAAPLRHGSPVTKVCFHPSGGLVLTLCGDGVVRLWSSELSPPAAMVLRGDALLWESWFSPDTSRLVTFDERGRARVWDAATGQPLTPLLDHAQMNLSASFSPDGQRAVMIGSGGTAWLWEASPAKATQYHVPLGLVDQISFSPEGQRYVVSHGVAQVFDARTEQLVLPDLTGGSGIFRGVFSPDGRRIVTGERNGRIQFWDAATGRPLALHVQHSGEITALEFNRAGTKLAVGDRDRTARVWNTETGEPLTPPLPHDGEVAHIYFSPDQRRLLTASRDGTARVWDATTGRPVTPPLAAAGLGRHWAQFSPNGRLVLSRREASVQVWDAETGVPIMPAIVSDKDLAGATFSADSRRLLVLVEDGNLRSYNIAPLDWPVAECTFAAHFLSSQTVDATEELAPWAGLVTSGARTNAADDLEQGWQRLRERLAELR